MYVYVYVCFCYINRKTGISRASNEVEAQQLKGAVV